MTNYDTEIRRIAENVRFVLANCTDAPRLLREYAGLYTEGEVSIAVEAAKEPLQLEIDRLMDTIDELRDEIKTLGDCD